MVDSSASGDSWRAAALRWGGRLAQLALGCSAVAVAAVVLISAGIRAKPIVPAFSPPPPAPFESVPSEPPSSQVAVESPPPSAADMLAAIEFGIVRIEASAPGGGRTLGAGFVLDDAGLVATNHHVLADATRATAFFRDGSAHEILGYRAVAPEIDLAIVQIAGRPLRSTPLPLEPGEPRRLEPVVAIGHPQGMAFSPYNGMVSRVVGTEQLPPQGRQFVRLALTEAAELTWIQHTAQLSEGNSGGPLVNAYGKVVGINTWMDRDTQFSFALHAKHVRELLRNPLPKLAPLEQFARRPRRLETAASRLSAEHIAALLAEGDSCSWEPVDLAQYDQLAELAWSIVAMGTLDGLRLVPGEARQRQVSLAADQALAHIRQCDWSDSAKRAVVNRLAQERLENPSTGVFFFARVEHVFRGEGGRKALLMRLEGGDILLLLPVDSHLSLPQVGTLSLVLGVAWPDAVVQFGENPPAPRRAQRVVTVANTIIPLTEPATEE
mgnify:CR=1 FL=1